MGLRISKHGEKHVSIPLISLLAKLRGAKYKQNIVETCCLQNICCQELGGTVVASEQIMLYIVVLQHCEGPGLRGTGNILLARLC